MTDFALINTFLCPLADLHKEVELTKEERAAVCTLVNMSDDKLETVARNIARWVEALNRDREILRGS